MKRCTSVDPGAMPRLRFDREIPIHELQSFAHADEAKPSTCRLGCGQVESLSRVCNHEMNIVPCSPQDHVEMFDVAVFRRIVERLLENSEEAQRNVRGHMVWHIMSGKINVNALLLGELVAKGAHRRGDAQRFEFGGMQLVRQRLNIGRDLHGLRLQLNRLPSVTQTGRGDREFRQVDRQQGETLTDIVMKFSGNSGAFLLLRVNQLVAQARKGLFGPILLGDIPGDLGNPHQGAARVRKRCEGQRHIDRVPCFRQSSRSKAIDPLSGSQSLEQPALFVLAFWRK